MHSVTELVKEFVEDSQKKVDEDYKKYPSLEVPKLKISDGRKYIKIVRDNSVWAFIDRTTGDILKPASWDRPAKNARANLFNKESWKNVSAHGPAYMRR